MESAATTTRAPRRWLIGAVGVAAFATAACGVIGGAKDQGIRKLAIGTWACAPDGPNRNEQPFTVTIADHGTFTVELDEPVHPYGDPDEEPIGAIKGTWSIEDGDLEWGFVNIPNSGAESRISVLGFDAVTLDSTSITLTNSGMFRSSDVDGGAQDTQKIITKAHGTDSVTLRLPAGKPWTCDRK